MVRRYGNLAWTRTRARGQTGFKVNQRWIHSPPSGCGEGSGTTLGHAWTLTSAEHSGHTFFSQVKNCRGAISYSCQNQRWTGLPALCPYSSQRLLSKALCQQQPQTHPMQNYP